MAVSKVYQGDDVDIIFGHPGGVKDVTGALIDLSGSTLYCDVRLGAAGTPQAASSTTVNATAGTATARFASALTTAWASGGTYTYDARVRTSGNLILTIGTGTFTVIDGVTPNP